MRLLAALIIFANPAAAWEFTPGLPCILSHSSDTARIELTYDPVRPLYTVTIFRDEPFDPAPEFSMRFDGEMPNRIATLNHVPSEDRRSVTVTDRRFGNVLNGLQYNRTVTAILGNSRIRFSLTGAADAVAAFRACRVEAAV